VTLGEGDAQEDEDVPEWELRKKHPITVRPIYVPMKDVSSVHKRPVCLHSLGPGLFGRKDLPLSYVFGQSFDHLMTSIFGYFFAVWWSLLVMASSDETSFIV
jgi:hypothetical protein